MDKEDVVYIPKEYQTSIEKNEILPFAATWMDLKGIMLRKLRQGKTNTIFFHSWMGFKKQKLTKKKRNKLKIKQNKNKKNRLLNTEVKLVVAKGQVGWDR